jgi:hypothetical protein
MLSALHKLLVFWVYCVGNHESGDQVDNTLRISIPTQVFQSVEDFSLQNVVSKPIYADAQHGEHKQVLASPTWAGMVAACRAVQGRTNCPLGPAGWMVVLSFEGIHL